MHKTSLSKDKFTLNSSDGSPIVIAVAGTELSQADLRQLQLDVEDLKTLKTDVAGLKNRQPNMETKIGERFYATQIAGGNWLVNGTCPDTYKAVSYYCQVDSGIGKLQNIGVIDQTHFNCLWTDTSSGFSAWGEPICLKVTN